MFLEARWGEELNLRHRAESQKYQGEAGRQRQLLEKWHEHESRMNMAPEASSRQHLDIGVARAGGGAHQEHMGRRR